MKIIGGALGVLGIVVLVLLAASLFRGLQQPPNGPGVVAQQPPVQEPPVTQPDPQPTATQEPVVVPEDPPTRETSQSHACSGTVLKDNVGNDIGCHVPGSTDLAAGDCVDFDPRSTNVEGPHSVIGEEATRKRVEMSGSGRYVGQYPATIYWTPCTPF